MNDDDDGDGNGDDDDDDESSIVLPVIPPVLSDLSLKKAVAANF